MVEVNICAQSSNATVSTRDKVLPVVHAGLDYAICAKVCQLLVP